MTVIIGEGMLQGLVDRDQEFLALARGAEVAFDLASPTGTLAGVRVRGERSRPDADVDFTITLAPESWAQLLADVPRPGTQHLLAHLEPRGSGWVSGDCEMFAQHLHLLRRAVEILADRRPVAAAPVDRSRITGRYVSVDIVPWGPCDVFVEEAGSGRPVLLLHTAGSDASQYHGLLGLAELFSGRRLIAFDLPWHGRSAPPQRGSIHDYSLTSETYAACIVSVIAALQLPEPPVIVGASMAGAVVVEVAARHPEAIAAAVGCQAGPRVGNRHNSWLRSAVVNQAVFVPEWTYGLMSPHSPKSDRDRVWWGYSQGGFGVYERDISWYSSSWDIDNVAHLFGPHTPPVVLMSGAYDYTVPPAATRELAARIPGSIYRDMPELGHFPHAENPQAFAAHLIWALQEIDRFTAASHE